MDKETEKKKRKGRLSWLIPVLEIIVAIAYLAIGFSGIMEAFKEMDFSSMFESVTNAIWFLVIATAVITLLCFFPVFKSKTNKWIAIWNIVWIGFTVFSIV